MKPCNDGKTNFQWECEQKRILDNSILIKNKARTLKDQMEHILKKPNIQGVLPHSQMLDNVKVVQNTVKTDLKEFDAFRFTNLGKVTLNLVYVLMDIFSVL